MISTPRPQAFFCDELCQLYDVSYSWQSSSQNERPCPRHTIQILTACKKETFENIVDKEEDAGNQHFLFLLYVYQRFDNNGYNNDNSNDKYTFCRFHMHSACT